MRFIHNNLRALLVTLGMLVGIACWFGTELAPLPRPPATSAEPWELPRPVEHDLKKALAAITARNLWGVVDAAAAAAPPTPAWRVLGIARSGPDRFILLVIDGKPVEMLKVGDALPDGLKIVEIEKDRFFVQSADKKKFAFGIHQNDPAK